MFYYGKYVILYASFAAVLLNHVQDCLWEPFQVVHISGVVWTTYRLYFWMLLVLKVMHTQLEFVSGKSRFVVLTELNELL